MDVGKKYVTKDDLEAFARKLLRRISGIASSGAGSAGGASSAMRFLDLQDVPGSYSGEARKHVRVKAAEDGLEFVENALGDLDDVDFSTSAGLPNDGDCLTYDEASGDWVAAPCGSGSGGVSLEVCDLNDVDCGSPFIPEDGDGLLYDAASGDWRPTSVAAELSSLIFSYRVQGRYYGGNIGPANLTTGSFSADYVRAIPFIVSRKTSFDRIGLGVTSGGSAGRYMRLGIYRQASGDYAYPGDLVVDSGAIEVTSNQYWEANIDEELTPGLYYLAFTNSYAFTIRSITGVSGGGLPIVGAVDGATQYAAYFTLSRAYDALPNPYTAGASVSTTYNPPNVVLRVK
jgi:hypothetical protein